MKNYDGITFGALEIYDENGTHLIELNEKRTILGQKLDEPIVSESVWILEDDSLDDYQVIKFGDTVIWSEDNNTDDKIPDYVYEYDRFESGNYDIAWIMALDEGYLGAQYPDRSCKYWDIDGNIVYEGKSDVDETPVY